MGRHNGRVRGSGVSPQVNATPQAEDSGHHPRNPSCPPQDADREARLRGLLIDVETIQASVARAPSPAMEAFYQYSIRWSQGVMLRP